MVVRTINNNTYQFNVFFKAFNHTISSLWDQIHFGADKIWQRSNCTDKIFILEDHRPNVVHGQPFDMYIHTSS